MFLNIKKLQCNEDYVAPNSHNMGMGTQINGIRPPTPLGPSLLWFCVEISEIHCLLVYVTFLWFSLTAGFALAVSYLRKFSEQLNTQ